MNNKDLVDQIVNKLNNLEINNELQSSSKCKCSNPNCISNEFENSYYLNPKFYKKGDYYINEYQDYLTTTITKYKQDLKYEIDEIELEKKKGKNVNIKALDMEIKIVKDNYMALINAVCCGFFVFGPE